MCISVTANQSYTENISNCFISILLMYCDYDFKRVTGIFNINERSLKVYEQIKYWV